VDAASAAHGEPVNDGVRDVVQDRQVNDPADLGIVGAADRSPQLLAEETGDVVCISC
jgi:hypothetical protein